MKKTILTYVFSCMSVYLNAQIGGSDRIVISSGGNGDVTIGELVVGTSQNNGSGNTSYFLLGFQQPLETTVLQNPNNGIYSVNGELQNQVSCIGNKDGRYNLNLLNVNGAITIWLVNTETLKLDTLVSNKTFTASNLNFPIDGLVKGSYKSVILYFASDGSNSSEVRTFQITENNIVCNVNPTNGVTPNNDGINDDWIIKGIEEFKDNEVEIFNRWGQSVWKEKAYNNSSVVFKGLNSKGDKLIDGTYFYAIVPDKNTKPIKGWLEIVTP
jgi:gliding motility-associated-like protein